MMENVIWFLNVFLILIKFMRTGLKKQEFLRQVLTLSMKLLQRTQ